VLVTLEFDGMFVFLTVDALHFYLFTCCTTVFGLATEIGLSRTRF